MGGAQLLKRIPLIKFPQRHPKLSGSATETQAVPKPVEAPQTLFSMSSTNSSVGGKASEQPKRTPITDKEMEAILLGGIF
ncbi:hypothetical protein C5167_034177 [Papaver somniferum]|uniref:Uncharacterized protein n=1 Tax=Papaver somniferum TaxID=3469 RepID=A0A4Y7KCA7_PAPSO|nr:uncharacterized protein LOC113299163 [Papaver somniferum]RZC71004.1 hypothetical protein C5167_034177 [Papaver somniferum]